MSKSISGQRDKEIRPFEQPLGVMSAMPPHGLVKGKWRIVQGELHASTGGNLPGRGVLETMVR